MAQDEVETIIKSNPERFFTPKELSDLTGVSQNTIGVNIKKLRKWNLPNIIVKEEKYEGKYGHKYRNVIGWFNGA